MATTSKLLPSSATDPSWHLSRRRPSRLHEALLLLFRSRPTLAAAMIYTVVLAHQRDLTAKNPPILMAVHHASSSSGATSTPRSARRLSAVTSTRAQLLGADCDRDQRELGDETRAPSLHETDHLRMAEQRRSRERGSEACHDDAPREVSDVRLPDEEGTADSSAEDEEVPLSIECAHGVTRRAWRTLRKPLQWRSRRRRRRIGREYRRRRRSTQCRRCTRAPRRRTPRLQPPQDISQRAPRRRERAQREHR
jgi:hypothetical protein